tara:strand:+ start:2880 stop:3692 length:813 start_codon:yes stop_codon:yes gene_type:complete
MNGQFGEVLLLKKLFIEHHIPKTCVEFGAYDGVTNSNTYYFWEKRGFEALLIEPDPNLFQQLQVNSRKNCTTINEFVSIENNLSKIIKKHNFPNKIGLLSIDIDSNDLEIFKLVDHNSTYIVVIEFNNQFPVWVDYSDPDDTIVFRHSALAVLKFASKKGYRLLDVKGSNLILINTKNLNLPNSLFPKSLEECFDYSEQKKACKDIRVIGSKFTTNAKVFSERPGIILKTKKFIFQIILIINYKLRGKLLPPKIIPENCKKRILDSGLYI